MLTVYSDSSARYCDHVSRRGFLQIGLAGAGLALSDVLRLQAATSESASRTAAPRIKSVIMVCLGGGPSHLDMYDMKPHAPREYRGEFQPISTNVSGIQISELLPLQAKLADKFSIVRSLQWKEPEQHQLSEVFTGYTKKDARPSFGSIVSRLHKPLQTNQLPKYVSISGFYDQNLRMFEDAGYAGAANRPFFPQGEGLNNLKLPQGITVNRMGDRRHLLGELDKVRREIDARGEMRGIDTFNGQALDMVTSGKVAEAFDISKEPEKLKQRYGTQGATFRYANSDSGWDYEAFIRARRLAEAGVPVITLRVGTWDHHGGAVTGDIFSGLRSELPLYDKSISALISDLHERGLQNDVAVVVWGEFGRTPRINAGAGRDHWPDAGFALVSGGGMKMGQTIGATDARGERPANQPYGPQNMFSTLYRLLGIDPAAALYDLNGRPTPILDNREAISELL